MGSAKIQTTKNRQNEDLDDRDRSRNQNCESRLLTNQSCPWAATNRASFSSTNPEIFNWIGFPVRWRSSYAIQVSPFAPVTITGPGISPRIGSQLPSERPSKASAAVSVRSLLDVTVTTLPMERPSAVLKCGSTVRTSSTMYFPASVLLYAT